MGTNIFISLLLLGAVQSGMSCCDLVEPCKIEIITFRSLMPIEQLAYPRGTHEGAFADRYRRHFLMSRPRVAVDSALGVHKYKRNCEMVSSIVLRWSSKTLNFNEHVPARTSANHCWARLGAKSELWHRSSTAENSCLSGSNANSRPACVARTSI